MPVNHAGRTAWRTILPIDYSAHYSNVAHKSAMQATTGRTDFSPIVCLCSHASAMELPVPQNNIEPVLYYTATNLNKMFFARRAERLTFACATPICICEDMNARAKRNLLTSHSRTQNTQSSIDSSYTRRAWSRSRSLLRSVPDAVIIL